MGLIYVDSKGYIDIQHHKFLVGHLNPNTPKAVIGKKKNVFLRYSNTQLGS